MRMQYSPSGALTPIALLAVALAVCATAHAQEAERPARINGHPNLNGIWQAMNTAYWNLEGHSAEAIDEFWRLGALFAIPAGQSVVAGGRIPYLPHAIAQRDDNRAGWPASDPETKCYRTGIPRQTYLPYPFEIIQGDGDILFAYSYATSNRVVRMQDRASPEEAVVDQYLGWSNGRWEDETLVIDVFGLIPSWLDRSGNYHNGTVVERYTLMGENHLLYEATINDPSTFSRPWTISMPLYRRVERNAERLEYKCVEFAEPLIYGDLLKTPPK